MHQVTLLHVSHGLLLLSHMDSFAHSESAKKGDKGSRRAMMTLVSYELVALHIICKSGLACLVHTGSTASLGDGRGKRYGPPCYGAPVCE